MAWKNPNEIATLIVNGQRYDDWKTVTVIDDTDTHGNPTFQFEATEFTPLPSQWSAYQIQPGDPVTVLLAGQQAINGVVEERRVNYDANNHQIMIAGKSKTAILTTSSIPPEKNGNYDNKSLSEIAKDVAGYFNIPVKEIGKIPDKKFKYSQINVGEIPYLFLMRHANMRDVTLCNSANGELILLGERSDGPVADLAEGRNILRCTSVWRDDYAFSRHMTPGQHVGSDAVNMDPQNKGWAGVNGTKPNSKKVQINMADTPTSDRQELTWRARMARRHSVGMEFRADITVQGWVRTDGSLWRVRDNYRIFSPMLILNGETMICRRAVYDQRDGAGTTTTLEMINPEALNNAPGSLKVPAGAVQ